MLFQKEVQKWRSEDLMHLDCALQSTCYEKRFKNRTRPNFDDGCCVKITKSCCERVADCVSNAQTQVILISRSGKHVKSVDADTLYDLCLYHMNHGKLKSSRIKESLLRIFPRNKPVTVNDMFSVRIRVQRLIPILNGDKSFENFEKAMITCNLPKSLDDKTCMNDDEVLTNVNDIWRDMLNQNPSDQDALVTFQHCLESLSQFKGFSYEIFSDDNGMCTGAVWMTATTRSNFERFGH